MGKYEIKYYILEVLLRTYLFFTVNQFMDGKLRGSQNLLLNKFFRQLLEN